MNIFATLSEMAVVTNRTEIIHPIYLLYFQIYLVLKSYLIVFSHSLFSGPQTFSSATNLDDFSRSTITTRFILMMVKLALQLYRLIYLNVNIF